METLHLKMIVGRPFGSAQAFLCQSTWNFCQKRHEDGSSKSIWRSFRQRASSNHFGRHQREQRVPRRPGLESLASTGRKRALDCPLRRVPLKNWRLSWKGFTPRLSPRNTASTARAPTWLHGQQYSAICVSLSGLSTSIRTNRSHRRTKFSTAF